MRDIVATLDDDKKGLFYAVHYGDRYYWGKLQHVFALEPEDDARQVEISFLSYKMGGWWEFPRKLYVEIIETKYVFLALLHRRTRPQMVINLGQTRSWLGKSKKRFTSYRCINSLYIGACLLFCLLVSIDPENYLIRLNLSYCK